MNEKDIKTSIRMYFRPMYDVNYLGIEKLNNSMTKDKYNMLVNSVHSSWCDHLLENDDNNYDISLTYDQCNHVKVPTTKQTSSKSKTITNTSSIISFHGKFSIISTLLTPIKLRIFNCSHRHHCESVVHRGSMINIVIPKNFFILFQCALVHCGYPSWFIQSGSYHPNTRSFFTIVETSYNVVNKRIGIILPDQFCNLETCSVFSNNKYGMVANNCPLIDTRNIKSSKELQGSDIVLGNLNLLGWVILKLDSKFNKVLNEPLAKLCDVDENGYSERLVNTDERKKILFPSNFKGIRFQKVMIFHFIFLNQNSNMIFLLLCII